MSDQQCECKKMTRKSFLKLFSALTIGGALFGNIFIFLRSITPNVLYEPLKRIFVGKPAKYPEGQAFLPKERLFINRKGNEFNSVSAVCTHLGCTVKEVKLAEPQIVTLPDGTEFLQEWEYHCPCHGSKFRADGTIYEGPAPTNLPPYDMKMAPDGDIMVDTGKKVEKDFRMKV
ncbi:MAG: Rieske (2Fe-2S) protein [Desulfobulbaceae bacterium]|nr:Rieske (2Fe-2S) protein [Desulfobulbaceae bacterium]